MHLGYKAYLLSTKDGKRVYVARHNVTFDQATFPWRKPAEVDPAEPSEPLRLHHNDTLESMQISENASFSGSEAQPTFVVHVDLVQDEAKKNTQLRERMTRSQTAQHDIETAERQEQKRQQERDAIQNATTRTEREAQIFCTSEQQQAFEQAQLQAAEFLESQQQVRGEHQGGGAQAGGEQQFDSLYFDESEPNAQHACAKPTCMYLHVNRANEPNAVD
eukprot:779542-Rhodomonas_salina.1